MLQYYNTDTMDIQNYKTAKLQTTKLQNHNTTNYKTTKLQNYNHQYNTTELQIHAITKQHNCNPT